MQLVRDAEWNQKCVNSADANSIMRIKEFNREYVFWEVSRAFPKYYSLIQKAVRMLGIMFSGLWVRECDLCHETVLEPTEHMLLFCSKTNVFRETLWGRLLYRFGMPFFSAFISESPKGQIEMHFSGCTKILKNDADVTDCVKIFVTSLIKVHSKPDVKIVL